MKVRPYGDNDAEGWDTFLSRTYTSTFLHTRKFLSYHGDRFVDKSLIIEDSESNIIAVFPAAEMVHDNTTIVSHPGATYGGVLCGHALRGGSVVDAIKMVAEYYADSGYRCLHYKCVPYIYHRIPFHDDKYALHKLGAKLYRSDLSSCIDLSNRAKVSQRRKRGIKQALKLGVDIQAGNEWLGQFWEVLSENLDSKHKAQAVHTIGEIEDLACRFPEEIMCIVAVLNGKVISGVLQFKSENVVHAQYIASNEDGRDAHALDLVFDYCISGSLKENKRYFDFGISTESGGEMLNEGLFRFKTEYGSGSVTHEFFSMDLV